MDYRGPQAADYDNVQAFNTAFLQLFMADGRQAPHLLRHLPDPLARRCMSLTGLQRERLARTPLLLFSFREADSAFWDQLLNSGPNRQLFDTPAGLDAEQMYLLSAALGFIWQLARTNSYAARLICGASQHWCEQLAEKSVLEVVSVAFRPEVLELRRQHDEFLWRKLLFAGVARENSIRRAARISALQRVLTDARDRTSRRPQMAARQMQRPSLVVADDNEH